MKDQLATYKVHLPSTMIWFNIDPNITFKHGQVGDTVMQKQAVNTNAKPINGEYKILGVDSEFNLANMTIVLESISHPKSYLTVREGDWVPIKPTN
jgi:hypothetical protein